MHVVIAQMSHETNTFSPVVTDLRRFARGGDRPLAGEHALEIYRGTASCMGGYIAVAEAAGCEITVPTGANRIHLLALFDPSVASDHITDLLGSCGIAAGFGDPELTSTIESLEALIEKIKQAGGIAIPAHIEGSKGLLENVRNVNPDIQKSLNLFDAAQFLNTTHLDTVHPQLKKAASHIAVVRGSDAHSLTDFGRSFSWVKMDTPSLTALESAIKDNESCILNQEENPNIKP